MNNNNEYITINYFEVFQTLSFDFTFIWFAQKNNNELLFFKEDEDIFNLIVYNFEDNKIINQKNINLIKVMNSKVSNYVNKVINNKYLLYTNDCFLYIIDVDKMEIISIKELDNILNIFIVDDIIWTVEYKKLNNQKFTKHGYNYLNQYLLDSNSLELLKMGERAMTNKFVKYIYPLNNYNKILLFVEKRKIELLSS